MFVFVIVLFVFLVVQGYLVLEEETLIILASFIWVDAAGGMIKKVIESELVHKSVVIKEKFVWFLNLKKVLITKLLGLHESRLKLEGIISKIYEYFMISLLNDSLLYSINLGQSYSISYSQTLPYDKSNSLSELYLNRRVCDYFSLLHKSGSSLRNVKEYSLVSCGGISSGFRLTQVPKGL